MLQSKGCSDLEELFRLKIWAQDGHLEAKPSKVAQVSTVLHRSALTAPDLFEFTANIVARIGPTELAHSP